MGEDALSSTAATSPAPGPAAGTGGCAEFNLITQSPDPDQAVAGAAAVKKLLARA
jgi:hypothetical protein